MLYRKIIAVSSGIHKNYINTLCGHNAGVENVNTCGTRSNQRADQCSF
jgi:hypothetical protein